MPILSSSRGGCRHADGGAAGGRADSLLPRGQHEEEEGLAGTVPGRRWPSMVPLRRATGGLLVEVGTLTTQWDPLREPPPVQGGIQILGRGAPLDASIDLPVIVQLEFQQSFFETVEVPQIQFSDRVRDIPVVTQRWVLTVQIVHKTGKIQQVQCVAADVPVTAATSSSAEDRPFSTSAVFAWLWTSLRSCRRCLRFPSSTRS